MKGRLLAQPCYYHVPSKAVRQKECDRHHGEENERGEEQPAQDKAQEVQFPLNFSFRATLTYFNDFYQSEQAPHPEGGRGQRGCTTPTRYSSVFLRQGHKTLVAGRFVARLHDLYGASS